MATLIGNDRPNHLIGNSDHLLDGRGGNDRVRAPRHLLRILARTRARLDTVFSEFRRKIHPRATLVLWIALILCAISFPTALLLRLSPGDLTQLSAYQDETLAAVPIIVAVGFVVFS